jgi:hypothetical protein
VCPKRLSGHSGQPRASDPPFTRDPQNIPVDVLKDFVREQIDACRLRPLAKAWGVGHETLRKFATGLTEQPHPRQLALYSSKFLELHPSGYVREKRVDGKPVALPQLKLLLPADRERAQEVLDRIFALEERGADGVPEEAEKVREWMRKLLNAEFDAEVRFRGKRRTRKPAEE